MILNEKVEDFFNDKEINRIEREHTVGSEYHSLGEPVNNPYHPNYSSVLDFNIKSDTDNSIEASLSGIIDFINGQFVIEKLTISNELNRENVDIIKRLLNSVIVNLELEQNCVSTIYWRVNKEYTACLKACFDMGFSIHDSDQYSFQLVYFLKSFPIRKSYNTSKVTNTVGRMNYE